MTQIKLQQTSTISLQLEVIQRRSCDNDTLLFVKLIKVTLSESYIFNCYELYSDPLKIFMIAEFIVHITCSS